MGGALPRMPGMAGEFRQFQHARITNGKLLPFEPFVIHRHDVMKYVEPGAPWQPSGVPSPQVLPTCEDSSQCLRTAIRARDMAIARVLGLPETTEPLPDYVPPPGAQFVFVTVYLWGRLRGCMGLEAAKLNGDEELRGLVHSVLEDQRFENIEVSSPEGIAVSVSLLSNGANMGEILPEEVIRYGIPGRQMLQVNQGERAGMLLPFWAARESISRETYPREVIDKAGITRPPYSWLRFDCATFLADATGAGRLEGPLRRLPDERDDRELSLHLAELYSNYLLNHQLQDGSFCESYEPFSNRLRKGGNLPRLAHGAWVLARAGRTLEN